MTSRKTLAQRLGRVLQMIAGQSGHLPETSYDGVMGQPSMTGYCASKFAVRGFTESLRAEMVNEYPVRVSVIHPGGVKTNIATAALAEAAGESSNEPPRGANLQREVTQASGAEGSGHHC